MSKEQNTKSDNQASSYYQKKQSVKLGMIDGGKLSGHARINTTMYVLRIQKI